MQLKDFRVETDTDVTLYLQDGFNRLVTVSELPEVLLKDDYEQVRQALALRSEFLQRHINTWVQPLAIALAVILISFGTAKAAQMVQTKMTQAKATPPTAADAAIIQSMLTDSPATATTTPTAAEPTPVATVAEPPTAPVQPVATVTPASPALNRAVNTVAPVTTPITQTVTKVPVVGTAVQGVTNSVTNTLPPALSAPVKNLLNPNK